MKSVKFLRAFVLLLAVVASIALLVACNDGVTATDGTADATTESTTDITSDNATETPTSDIVLLENGECRYTFVRPAKPDDITVYTKLHQKLQNTLGATVKLDTDEFYRGHEYDAEKAEILCGLVAHPEAENGCDGLAFNEYRISVIGKKILISSATEDGLREGFYAFCSYISENINEDGSVSLKSDFVLVGKATINGFNYLFDDIPTVEHYASVALSHCGDGYEQATLSGATDESLTEYRSALEGEGFTLYAENTMAETDFVTYTKGELNVHAYYTPHNSEMRIIVSEGKNLPWKDEVTYTKVCEPTITLMGLSKSGSSGGLGMIMGLEDGSFIIIDGGNNNTTEANDLANTLKSLAPDPNHITIRAWLITHAHGDHIGTFLKFSELYAKSGVFTVEKFIYNFCDASSQRVHGGISYDKTISAMNVYWKDAERYKALTGEVYRFAGCDLEILYCMSDFIPQIIGEEKGISDIDTSNIDGNIETMVSRAKLGGQTFLITGDTSKVCVDEMCDRYGTYLKSDIMQVPHHGHNSNRYRARNGTVEFYQLVQPGVALWSSDENGYANRTAWNGKAGENYEANYKLANEIVKEMIVSGKTTRTLTLPYAP